MWPFWGYQASYNKADWKDNKVKMNLNVNSVNHFIGVLKTYNECLKMSESYFQNIRLQSKSDQCMWPIWGYQNHYSDQYV